MPAAAVVQGARHVSWAGLVRVFLRSLFLQASWNPRGMQNVGFADAIGPALTELYPEPAERAKAVAWVLQQGEESRRLMLIAPPSGGFGVTSGLAVWRLCREAQCRRAGFRASRKELHHHKWVSTL